MSSDYAGSASGVAAANAAIVYDSSNQQEGQDNNAAKAATATASGAAAPVAAAAAVPAGSNNAAAASGAASSAAAPASASPSNSAGGEEDNTTAVAVAGPSSSAAGSVSVSPPVSFLSGPELSALEREAEQLSQAEVESLLAFLSDYYTIDLVRLSGPKDATKDAGLLAQQQTIVADILRVEGCAQCLVAHTYEQDEAARAADADKTPEARTTSRVANDAFILLGCKLLHCKHVVHVLCVLKLQAKLRAAAAAGSVSKMILPTLDLCHSTSFFRVIAFPIGTQGSLLPSLPSSHNSPHHPTHSYYLELASTHHMSNAQNLHLSWTHAPVHSFVDMKTGAEYLMLLANHPEANHASYGDQVRPTDLSVSAAGASHSPSAADFASFFLTRGKFHFTCIQQTSSGDKAAAPPVISSHWTHTLNYDLSTTSASTPHMKLVLVDAASKNILTIGVQKIHPSGSAGSNGGNGGATLAIAYIKYEFAPALQTPPLSPPLSLYNHAPAPASVVSVLAGAMGNGAQFGGLEAFTGSTGALASAAFGGPFSPAAAALSTLSTRFDPTAESIVRDPRDPPTMRIGTHPPGAAPTPDPLGGIAGIEPQRQPHNMQQAPGSASFTQFDRYERERGGNDGRGGRDRNDRERGGRGNDRFGNQSAGGAGGANAGAGDFYSNETGDWDLAMLDAALDRQLADRRNKPDPFGDRPGGNGGAGGNWDRRRGSDDRTGSASGAGLGGGQDGDTDALFLPALPSFPTHLMSQPGMANQPVLNLTLEQVRGNVVRLSKSHSGSRFVQSKLEMRDSSFFETFYNEMRDHVPDLMCFPLDDTRILTNRGFLFYDQIVAVPDYKKTVLFACFQKGCAGVGAGSIVYRPATHWVEPHVSEHPLVDFTQPDDSLSIRVTGNHKMHVATGAVETDGQLDSFEFTREPAITLVSGGSKRVVDAAQKEVAPEAAGIRFQAIAELGYDAADTLTSQIMQRLGLPSADAVPVFLELYGASLQQMQSGQSGALVLTHSEPVEAAWVQASLETCGLALDVDFHKSASAAGSQLSISNESWCNFFRSEDEKSHRLFASWVYDANCAQLQTVVRGMQRSLPTEEVGTLSASSVEFRDELQHILIRAGYTTHFDRNGASWRVHYSSAVATASCYPTMLRSDIKIDAKYSEPVWCVTVDHDDHLVVVQRAHRTEGVVTAASRPVVVGQCDNFGHFAIEKLIAWCNDEQALTLLQRLAPNINIVACQKHGSFSVQALVDTLHTPAQIYTLVEAMKPDILRIITHASGHFVVLRMLQRFPYQSTKFIDENLIANCATIGTDHHGLRVVKAVLAVRRSTELTRLFKQVARLTMKLVENQYGNYCVQAVLDVAPPGVRTNIKVKMEGKYMRLSKQKFSSNVVERCLKQSSSHWRTIIIRELIAQPAVSELLRDRYGNYVLQTALAVANAQQVQEILRSITPYLPSLRDNVRSKWKKMLRKAGSLAAAGQAGTGFTGLGGDSPQPTSPASPSSPASRSDSPFNDPPSLQLGSGGSNSGGNNSQAHGQRVLASVFINPNQNSHAHHAHHNVGHHGMHNMHQSQLQQPLQFHSHNQHQSQFNQQLHGGAGQNSFSQGGAGVGDSYSDRSGNFNSNWGGGGNGGNSGAGSNFGGSSGYGASGSNSFNPNSLSSYNSSSYGAGSNPGGAGVGGLAGFAGANAFSLGGSGNLSNSLAAQLNNPYGVAGLNALGGGVGGGAALVNAAGGANVNSLAGLGYGFGTGQYNVGGVNTFGALGGGLGGGNGQSQAGNAANTLYDPTNGAGGNSGGNSLRMF